MQIKCIVAGINLAGEADLFPVIVDASEEQIARGAHLDPATRLVSRDYGEAQWVCDENDPCGRSLKKLFVWNEVPTVIVSGDEE